MAEISDPSRPNEDRRGNPRLQDIGEAELAFKDVEVTGQDLESTTPARIRTQRAIISAALAWQTDEFSIDRPRLDP